MDWLLWRSGKKLWVFEFFPPICHLWIAHPVLSPVLAAMGMIVRRPRWLQGGQYSRHFFALEAIFLALLAVTSISSCPRKCQCIWRDSKITVDCSDQELAAIPTTVEANTQVSNNIYAMSLLTAWMVNHILKHDYTVLYNLTK